MKTKVCPLRFGDNSADKQCIGEDCEWFLKSIYGHMSYIRTSGCAVHQIAHMVTERIGLKS